MSYKSHKVYILTPDVAFIGNLIKLVDLRNNSNCEQIEL